MRRASSVSASTRSTSCRSTTGPWRKRPELKGRVYNILGIEDYLAPGGAIEGLQRIQRSGKTKHIGFICRGEDGPQVKQLIDTGLFSLINVVYTLMNPSAVRLPQGMAGDPDYGGVIAYAREKGVGAAIYSPLAGGLLTDQILSGGEAHPSGARAARHRRLARARSSCSIAPTLCASSPGSGQSMAQAATRFILSEPGVTVSLGGFSDVQQVEEIARASDMGPLSAEEMAGVEKAWRGETARALQRPEAVEGRLNRVDRASTSGCGRCPGCVVVGFRGRACAGLQLGRGGVPAAGAKPDADARPWPRPLLWP